VPTAHDMLLSSSHVGDANRARLIRLLYVHGPQSRTELAQHLGVSRSTISAVVQPLLDEEVLVEQAPRMPGRSGGKPGRPLWFGTGYSVGAVFLSPDELIAAVLGMDGTIRVIDGIDLTAHDRPDLSATVLEHCQSVFGDRRMVGIGAAFAGMVDTTDGVLLENYRRPSVNRMPVAASLTKRFGAPVFVDHHPRFQALGDAWFGLGRDLDSFASGVTGEVLGAGYVLGGQVERGIRGAGGEAGHMVVDMNGLQCPCGRRGCWETVATLGWLRDQAITLGLPDAANITAASLCEGSASGSVRHKELLDRYARSIALGLANLEQLLGLGTYIMHGDVAASGESVRQAVEEQLVRASPRRAPAPRVLFADQPDLTTILGATGLVLSKLYRQRL